MNRRRRWLALALTATLLLIAAGGVWLQTGASAPSFESVRSSYVPTQAYLLDRHGKLLQTQRIDYQLHRLAWVRLDQVSPATRNAIMQAEDRRFYEHHGVDLRALVGAGAADSGGQRLRGASTLTMQLVALLQTDLMARDRHRSPLQKLRQMRAAWALERSWSKPQIFEAYLNLVGFRGEMQGIAAAAQRLFHKSPDGLTDDESWLLAALLPAPSASPERVAQRACALLHRQQSNADCAELNALAQRSLDATRETIVVDDDQLAPQLAVQLLHRAGEQVSTTLDADLQRAARGALSDQLKQLAGHDVHDAAAVVLDNLSGDILAYVGSVASAGQASAVDGVRARRQAGSTLKPFLYGFALDQRYLTAASLLDDSPVRLETGNGLYIPQDYDHDFHGLVSVRSALAGSLNVPAVRTLVLVGTAPFLDVLHDFGYRSIDQTADFYGYALALGSAEVSLLEQANAYRALANGGNWSPTRLLVDDPTPTLMRPVLSADAAFVVGDILSDRASRALTFGLDSPLSTPFWSAVKTGTSKFMRDNWCIGYTQRYTVAVWFGNFDGRPMREVSGVSGAAPAWLAIMRALPPSEPAAPSPPSNLLARSIEYGNRLEPPRREWFLSGTALDRIDVAPPSSLRPRLLSPADGMVVALDPDIPAGHQQLVFRAAPRRPGLRFELDGTVLASAERDLLWAPRAGSHVLRLIDRAGLAQDQLAFSVRGPMPSRSLVPSLRPD